MFRRYLVTNHLDIPATRFKVLVEILNQARLTWRLFWDDRVPLTAKLVIPGALLALISPIDLIPDFFVGLFGIGVLDDLAVILLATRLFVALVPESIVNEHLARLRGGKPELPPLDATFRPAAD
jgi:uncharacterized membrane protein YkvA (DUF1232 family)